MIPKYETKPRWPNAPQICLKTNLPSFPTMKDLADYMTKYCPRESYTAKQCKSCDGWHVKEKK